MMKRTLLILASALCLCCCGQKPLEPKVMARYVPERADDFVFENNLIAGRIYGKALEGNPTSPGIDIWVKKTGRLVANEWYAQAQVDPNYYHHDHGEGKDCYKVGRSLGGGGSAFIIENRIMYPATNYRSWEILESSPEKIVFVLHYPEWTVGDLNISFDKKITVTADSYFCRVDDTYKFSGAESLCIAAGMLRHGAQETIVEEMQGDDRYAIWEHASDQSVEPEEGMLGVAVVMPGAQQVFTDKELDHSLCTRIVRSGEPLTYYFGSCWSRGDIPTAEAWFETVRKVK
jgi:hypothetical protein